MASVATAAAHSAWNGKQRLHDPKYANAALKGVRVTITQPACDSAVLSVIALSTGSAVSHMSFVRHKVGLQRLLDLSRQGYSLRNQEQLMTVV